MNIKPLVMKLDKTGNWEEIRKHFRKSFRTSLHVAVASADARGNPTVTPIGSLFLNRDRKGFYFEKFPSKLPSHATGNKNICVLGVNSNRWTWLKALFLGKFSSPPAIRLYGTLGVRRRATAAEISRLQRRMKATRGLEGHKYLWGDMRFVREVNFSSTEPIHLGEMTRQL